MFGKLNNKKIVAIIFVCAIFLCGVLTLALSPKEIMGGLVRGYLDAPEESSVFKKVSSSFQKFDSRASEYFVLHDASIHAYGGIQRLVGRNLVHDTDKNSEVLKLNNGYLTFKSNNTDLTGLSEYLLSLKETCDSTGSHLVYVNKVSKSSTDELLYPKNYPYIHSSNFNEIQPILEQSGISIIDFNQIVTQQNLDKYFLFFKTDHHWTPQAGLWVAENICSSLNESYQWDLKMDL